MGYELYMGNILCPVTPSKIQMKIKNQNKTMNLANGEEVNILKSAGLTEISYDLLLPNVKYNFAVYKSGFVGAEYFLNEFEKMKVEKKVFVFKVLRTLPSGKALFNTGDNDNMMVSLEDYTIKEDAKQGFDIVVSIKLKQFKHYGTKIVKVIDGTASVEQTRETTNAPSAKTHKVVAGDTLWNIAKKYYGNGAKYTAIYEANKNIFGGNPNLIYPGQVLTLPGATGNYSNVPNVTNSPSGSTDSGGYVGADGIIRPSEASGRKVSPVYVTINMGGVKMYSQGYVKISYKYNLQPVEKKIYESTKIAIDRGCDITIDVTNKYDNGGCYFYCSYATIKSYSSNLTYPIKDTVMKTKIYNDQIVETFWRYKDK